MATLKFKNNGALSTLGLILSVGLMVGVRSSSTVAAPDVPTSITFEVLETACNGYSGYNSTTVTFSANGTAVATLDPRGDCTCSPGAPKSVTVSDPSVMAMFSTQGCTLVSMTWNSQLLIGWARATVNRPSGTEVLTIVDKTGGFSNYVCYTWETGLTYSNNLADTNDNGVPDCTDPDIDGDGVLNAADNCPYLANPSQADADGNGTGDACQPAVVAVPWLGSEALAHQVYSGGSIILQAVATLPGDGSALALASGTWDPGDGSGPQSINVSNSLALELPHTYAGSTGQPFTATVRVVDTTGNAYTDTFKVVIAPNSQETKVNMAIDKGLWNLHKRMTRTTSDGLPSAYWTGFSGYHMAATASVMQAYEINNHRESGDASKDPYVVDVARGLRYILSQQHGLLQRMNVPTQNGNNPDANGNGYGLVVSPNDHSSYIGGQFIDAIVASGTPNKTAATGQATYVKGRTYKDIVQDMLDGYSWGMADNVGGWHYQYQDVYGNNDTSASHWWAIGVLAAEVWGLDAPVWVKNIQWNIGVPLMQNFSPPSNCYFGYTNSPSPIWDAGTNVTAAGLILMNADDISKTHARYTCAMGYLANTFNGALGNFYTMYQLAKAMRTAHDDTGAISPITLLNGTRDWYADYARHLIANQNGSGAFVSTSGTASSYIVGDMASSWAIIILSPSLFELPPTAACTANPATIGKHGGLVNFTAAASFHPDPAATITGYAWNFGDATTGTGVTTSHTYNVPASFPTVRNATVTVTDNRGNSSTASCPVTIVNDNVPPAVSTAGPFTMCLGSPLTLTGTATDEDGTVASSGWDLHAPFSPFTIDAAGNSVDATGVFTATGTYDIGFQATDDNGASTRVFTTVKVLPANDPSCNQPPTAVDDSASTFSGTPVTISVLVNDRDPDAGQTLTVTSSTTPENGVAVINGDGTVTYTPNDGFAGTDTFTYTISDGHGGTATATVTVTVTRRAATVTAGDGTKVYGTLDPPIDATATGFLEADGITVSATRAAGENVGTYVTTATASGAALANYDVTYVAGSFTITRADATCSVTGYTVHYNGAPHTATGACLGVDGGTLTGLDLSGTTHTVVGVWTDPWTFTDVTGNYNNASGTVVDTITNVAPVCQVNRPMQILWPPNHQLVSINPLAAVTDADGDALTIVVTSIFQDEPTNDNGDGNTAIDGFGVGSAIAQVRAERTGDVKNPGNGRVYYISYTATDPAGARCTGTITVGVPHDQGGKATPIGDGPKYNSTVATAAPPPAIKKLP